MTRRPKHRTGKYESKNQARPQEIELTSKTFKGANLIGFLIFLLAFAFHNVTWIAAPLALIGLGFFAFGTIGGWWHHG